MKYDPEIMKDLVENLFEQLEHGFYDRHGHDITNSVRFKAVKEYFETGRTDGIECQRAGMGKATRALGGIFIGQYIPPTDGVKPPKWDFLRGKDRETPVNQGPDGNSQL